VTIKEFMTKVHVTAVDKGWWEKCGPGAVEQIDALPGGLRPRNQSEMLALMHSEIAEALEIHRMPDRKLADMWMSGPEATAKPEGFMVEIADLMIRIGDTCEAMGIPLDVVLCNTDIERLGWGRAEGFSSNPVEALQHMNVCLVYAFNGLRNGRAEDSTAEAFAEIFQTCGVLAKMVQVSLDYVLSWKMGYNETRPYRHGGKKC
jgi:hypothetical protein